MKNHGALKRTNGLNRENLEVCTLMFGLWTVKTEAEMSVELI